LCKRVETMQKRSIAFTGGGTGGHVYPGLAVAEALKDSWAENAPELLWIGSRGGMEGDIVRRAGLPFYSVPAGKLRRYLSLRNFFDLFSIAAGFAVSLVLLKRRRVGLLFSKGGYVSVPPVIAARLLGIPVISHESDRDPGLATRINARFSSLLLCAYEESCRVFSGRFHLAEEDRPGTPHSAAVGNPVRKAILQGSRERGRERMGVRSGEKMVLVLGGSLGARQINRLIDEVLEQLLPLAKVVHQTGKAEYQPADRKGYYRAPFFHEELPDLLAAADLVISRAGAGTLWENGVTGTPAVLIPLGTGSSRGDQLRNAGLFAERGAAVTLAGEEATAENLLAAVTDLLQNDEKRGRMAEQARALCNFDAAERIVRYIREYTHEYTAAAERPEE
jgi:UDP-N-acetylglucosamine--N-acetylmuramyl-(pentapeptide) pyrophosphoryl-undecaprenol N-acetylglucosamine transferase